MPTSLGLTAPEVDAIWTEAEQYRPPATSIDRLEIIRPLPLQLGKRHNREMELCPDLELSIFNETYHEDFIYRGGGHPPLVQFIVHLSDGGN